MKIVSSVVTLVHRLVPTSEGREKVFQVVKEREEFGYIFAVANASLELLIARVLDGKKMPFTVTAYHVSMRGENLEGASPFHVCDATLKVVVGGAQYHEVAEGDGPVDALDQALRLTLGKSRLPRVAHLQLLSYSVQSICGALEGTKAKTRALIETSDGSRAWSTTGVSKNVVEASALALFDSYEYAFMSSRGKA